MSNAHKKIIVGNWQEVTSNEGVLVQAFVPDAKQPEEPVTQIDKMCQWVESTYVQAENRTFEFVRSVPGYCERYLQPEFRFVDGLDGEEAENG